MLVTIRLPAGLRAYCGCEQAEVQVEAQTVQGALDELQRTLPAAYRGVCEETGAVRRHVNVFVNSSFVPDRAALGKCGLTPGDVITIMPAVSGG
jgi:molybdopterin converting factor small subunit